MNPLQQQQQVILGSIRFAERLFSGDVTDGKVIVASRDSEAVSTLKDIFRGISTGQLVVMQPQQEEIEPPAPPPPE